MPNWNEVLEEMTILGQRSPLDVVRKKIHCRNVGKNRKKRNYVLFRISAKEYPNCQSVDFYD